MKRKFEISNEPELVKTMITSIVKDSILSKTFESSIKNGKISGLFTNLAKVSSVVIGYVKVKGSYNLERGKMVITTIPSNLFWATTIALIIVLLLINFLDSVNSLQQIVLTTLLSVFIFLLIIIYLIESRSFIKHIKKFTQQLVYNNLLL